MWADTGAVAITCHGEEAWRGRAYQASVVERAGCGEQIGLTGRQHVNTRDKWQPLGSDIPLHGNAERIMDKRQAGRFDTRETATAHSDVSSNAVGIGQRFITHTAGVAHPEVSSILEADSPTHQHRRRVAPLGKGIGPQRRPSRVEHACQHDGIGSRQWSAPLAIGLIKGIGLDIGARSGTVGGKTQLWDGIGWIKHDPTTP